VTTTHALNQHPESKSSPKSEFHWLCRGACLAMATAFLAGCGEESKKDAPAASEVAVPATAVNPSPRLAEVLAAKTTGEPVDVHVVKSTAKPGETITLKGEIMGHEAPFVDGRAMFIIGDPGVLTPCNRTPGDTCTTPWDACCDSPEDKKRATATVQVLDPENRVLKEPIEGAGGVKKLASVVVSGVVAPQSTPDLLIINANAIEVR
jgi:hypothetical protein